MEKVEKSSGDEYDRVSLPKSLAYGRVIIYDSIDKWSKDTVEYCVVCDPSSPPSILYDAPGYKDSNCVYK